AELVLRLLPRAADEDAQPRHDLEMVAVAPAALHAGLDVGVERARPFDGLMCAEYDLGGLSRELAAVVRGARLHHGPLALPPARHPDRPAGPHESTPRVERLGRVRVGEAPLRPLS